MFCGAHTFSVCFCAAIEAQQHAGLCTGLGDVSNALFSVQCEELERMHCAFSDEAISDGSRLDAPIHFNSHAFFTSILLLIFTTIIKSHDFYDFPGEPYGSLSDLYEYDYGEGASENEIGIGKTTPQFLTQPQQLVGVSLR